MKITIPRSAIKVRKTLPSRLVVSRAFKNRMVYDRKAFRGAVES